MTVYEPSKADWKLFRERLPEWQERLMVRLCEEYAAILTGKKKGSEAFWEIDERIKRDKKRPGVICQMSKSEMPFIILEMLRDKSITMADLDGFSEDLRGRMEFLMRR